MGPETIAGRDPGSVQQQTEFQSDTGEKEMGDSAGPLKDTAAGTEIQAHSHRLHTISQDNVTGGAGGSGDEAPGNIGGYTTGYRPVCSSESEGTRAGRSKLDGTHPAQHVPGDAKPTLEVSEVFPGWSGHSIT